MCTQKFYMHTHQKYPYAPKLAFGYSLAQLYVLELVLVYYMRQQVN